MDKKNMFIVDDDVTIAVRIKTDDLRGFVLDDPENLRKCALGYILDTYPWAGWACFKDIEPINYNEVIVRYTVPDVGEDD